MALVDKVCIECNVYLAWQKEDMCFVGMNLNTPGKTTNGVKEGRLGRLVIR